MKRPPIILDRDGVINHDSEDFIRSVDEWVPIDGSIDAIARLSQAGYRVIVASNQSGLARGLFGQSDLDAMHARLHALVEAAGGKIEAVFVCPDMPPQPEDRKQRLFQRISGELGIPLSDVPAVGDSLRDIQAAQDTGARPILVRTGNGAAAEAQLATDTDVAVYDDLAAVADALLQQN